MSTTHHAVRLVPHLPALVLLASAALFDLRTRRIPNALTLTLAIGGLLHGALSGGGASVLWGALGSLAALALAVGVLYLPFAAGLIGGGDVKLLAAAAAWLGVAAIPPLLVATALAGGGLSIVGYLRASGPVRRAVRGRLAAIVSRASPSASGVDRGAEAVGAPGAVPYGVAIAAAGMFLILARS
jgi:prepilin peptidase CpaA